MLAPVLLVAMIAGGPVLPPPAPPAVRTVPDEPGAIMLPEAPTYQAVVADLDADGARELVRLIRGERGSIVAEAWRQDHDGWVSAGSVEVVPDRPTGAQADVEYAGAPVRLLVRGVADSERVTLVRQPRFEEPGLEADCCLLVDDLVLADSALRLSSVSVPGTSADAVLVLDLDGDGTDELLVTRSLPPLGDISFPTEARVYRWSDGSFEAPAITELPIGSGDTPFVLGDADGHPGEEAGFIPSRGPNALHRVSLTDGDRLLTEDSGLPASDARAVPLGTRRGVAIITSAGQVSVHRWPRGAAPGPAEGRAIVEDGDLLAAVPVLEEPRLLVSQPARGTLHLLTLPELGAPGFTITRSPAAGAFEAGLLEPYIGPLPGGGPDAEEAIVYAGRLVPSEGSPEAPFPTRGAALLPALAGVQPVGMLGRDQEWLALLHAPLPTTPIDPRGGRLDGPVTQPGSGVSIAPFELLREPERDDASLDPPVDGGVAIDGQGTLGVGGRGFTTVLEAPPGSRVYVGDADPSVLGGVRILPESGRIDVTVIPVPPPTPNLRQRVAMAVVTPAGHGYLATWEVRLLTAPPRLSATASTALGAPSVTVSGTTAPYAQVSVDGRRVDVTSAGEFSVEVPAPPWPTDISIRSVDPLGNATSATVSGIGILDYRTLPWIPITIVLVAGAAVLLFLRVPRLRPVPRRAEDDAVLEEMEPD